MIMSLFPTYSRFMAGVVVFLLCLAPGLIVSPAAGADIEMEGYLGETFTLHGVSYVGDSVYLFMTGPGLPENGVTLTDTSLRADQGHFTVVLLDENQEWTYIWKTSRISSEIDPGTYTVYVTNEPADLSHLGGTSSYKTLSVYLKDSGVSKVSINAQHAYTLNPEENLSTPYPAPSMNITSATTTLTSPPPTTTIPETPVLTAAPTTRADTGALAAVTALFCCGYLVSLLRNRP
jgi:hypothetical protein